MEIGETNQGTLPGGMDLLYCGPLGTYQKYTYVEVR